MYIVPNKLLVTMILIYYQPVKVKVVTMDAINVYGGAVAYFHTLSSAWSY